MGPFARAPENKKYILVAIDHFSTYPTLKYVKRGKTVKTRTDYKGGREILTKVHLR